MISIYHRVSVTILTVFLGLNLLHWASVNRTVSTDSTKESVLTVTLLPEVKTGLPVKTFETFTDNVVVSKLKPKQIKLLALAKKEGEKIGFPETIQAILLQESLAGLLGPVGDKGNGFGKRSYCPMQVKIVAARDVLKVYPDLGTWETNEELIAELLTNDKFCIKIGSLYFDLLYKNTKNWNKALLAYNKGLHGSRLGDSNNYVFKIKQKINGVVKPFNNTYLATGDPDPASRDLLYSL
jgi:hypothetical protein